MGLLSDLTTAGIAKVGAETPLYALTSWLKSNHILQKILADAIPSGQERRKLLSLEEATAALEEVEAKAYGLLKAEAGWCTDEPPIDSEESVSKESVSKGVESEEHLLDALRKQGQAEAEPVEAQASGEELMYQ